MASLQRTSSAPLARAGSGSLPPVPVPVSRLSRRGSSQHAAPSLSRACSCQALPEEVPSISAFSTPATDPFTSAGRRLQTLLSRVGDGEDEALNQLVEEETPESKLQTATVLGCGVTVASVVICSLMHVDPWGGVGFNAETAAAAGLGLAAALPMALLRRWSWTPAAAKVLPALQDVHDGQFELQRPWLASMGRGQVATLMALEVLPLTALLFPAGQAAIRSGVAMYGQLISGAGLPSQEAYLTGLALMLTAIVCGVGRSLELSVTEEEYDLVQTAAKNADRYYRTVTTDLHTTPADASRAAEAFRFVAAAWLQTKSEASLLAGGITGMDVLLLGCLWAATGNLAAPAIAALAVNGVDMWQLHSLVLKKEERARMASGMGGGKSQGPGSA
ncbi:hypothetical protein HYH03_004425 [Edaphochlamys debaryana]|uniref:Uncharacterized protein n=1 Tax=Edaphochlamys debaryana TaxID=47281 RepID=A0A835Y7V2_9CHLO|nr:hypothetical protein HYH03_004425 [Edaphochlamys debaryana]|eukprot:KAG2497688.1 hypothetical protein HYH03_004425 [Edaphochlamys debaryana]